MALNDFDQLMSDYLDELRTLLDGGLSPVRVTEFSTEERFFTVAKRLYEMARSRPDTKPIRREGFRQPISQRDKVFGERKERHDIERAAKE